MGLGACVGVEAGGALAHAPPLTPPYAPPTVEPLEPEHIGIAAGGRMTPLWEVEREGPPDGGELFADGAVHDLALTLSEDAIASLRAAPETEIEGTLGWRGQDFRAGVRLKGSHSFRTIDEKPSFKIDVHAFDPDQEIDGLERLTLNNMIQDRTMLRESTYYWLAARLGVPGPRHAYARVTVNGADYGLYSLVETMDEKLVKRAFAEDRDGNLYEGSGDDFTYDLEHFELEETRGVIPSPDDLEDLVDAVEATRSGGFDEMLSERFERDVVLTYFALDTVAGNDDGYVYNNHNFLAYHGVNSDRWQLLPWGTDRAFSREVPPLGDAETFVEGHLVLSCWADTTCAAALTETIQAVLDVWEDELADRVEATEDLIHDAAEADPRREKEYEPDDLEDFVDERADFLRGYL